MSYWIFTAAPYKNNTESFKAREIYDQRMKDSFWGLGRLTANRKKVQRGDQVVFYVAGPADKVFVGTARLASDCFELNPEQRTSLSHGTKFFMAEYGVKLEEIETWGSPQPIVALAPRLRFIKDPSQWGVYLQGGIRQIEEDDYFAIAGRLSVGPDASARTIENAPSHGQFALEAHLEEFIERNWPQIPWGAPLELYKEGDQNGRQYPAGTWSIDFLAVDRGTNELVVIELKRDQTSDATVGQVLRYINWVQENVAAPGQKVRGIIVASKVDDALRYAARGLPNVSAKTYTVQFALQAQDL